MIAAVPSESARPRRRRAADASVHGGPLRDHFSSSLALGGPLRITDASLSRKTMAVLRRTPGVRQVRLIASLACCRQAKVLVVWLKRFVVTVKKLTSLRNSLSLNSLKSYFICRFQHKGIRTSRHFLFVQGHPLPVVRIAPRATTFCSLQCN